MKPETVILAIASLGMLACSTNSDIGEPTMRKNIVFDAYINTTRAAQSDVTTAGLTSFYVTALGNGEVYFDNACFKKGASYWESTPYWYWTAYKLAFCAYNIPTDTTGTNMTTGYRFQRRFNSTDTALIVRIPSAMSSQEDLVAAFIAARNAPSGDAGTVSITFKHYLTQLTVNASNFNSNYTVKVKGVKIANLADSGMFKFSDATMYVAVADTNSSTSKDFIVEYDSEITLKSPTDLKPRPDSINVMQGNGEKTVGKWYLIPQKATAWDSKNDKNNAKHGTYLALKVSIKTKTGAKVYPADNSDYAWTAIPIPDALKLEQGKKYNVTVNFFKTGGAGIQDPESSTPSSPGAGNMPVDNSKPIVFSSTVSEWGDAVGVTIDL